MENNEPQISPGFYVNGKKQGIWIEYITDRDGNKLFMERGNYDEGVRYGKWRLWDISKGIPIERKKGCDASCHTKLLKKLLKNNVS